jgi:hypothetical protein
MRVVERIIKAIPIAGKRTCIRYTIKPVHGLYSDNVRVQIKVVSEVGHLQSNSLTIILLHNKLIRY